MSHCSKKFLVSRNVLRETENISARDLDVLIDIFLLQVREFLFLICVKKTISMKILVLRVINSSRRRNCFVRGYIHSLFVSIALTRSYLARSGFHTNNWLCIKLGRGHWDLCVGTWGRVGRDAGTCGPGTRGRRR